MAYGVGSLSSGYVVRIVNKENMKGYKTDFTDRVIFSPEMKIVELIEADFATMAVIMRFGMQLPFGDVSVEDLCGKYSVSSELFLMICKVYACKDYEPEVERLSSDDLKCLVSYLRASHHYYLTTLLPSIDAGIESVLGLCPEREKEVVKRFYQGYVEEVQSHLSFEEREMFPYIEQLAQQNYKKTMAEYMDDHTDICLKIGDIKSILVKYLPEGVTTEQRYTLLRDVFAMSEELEKHTLLEVKLLAPLVGEVERRLR